MDLTQTAAIAGRAMWLDSAASTNSELVRRATGPDAAAWPSGSVIITDSQTAGRGRLGRAWTAPAGTSLAISVLLRPRIGIEAWGWLSLLAGAAMTGAVIDAGAQASLKWPNDVLIGGRKVCGILAEVLPDASGVVVGAGLNHLLSEDQLPVPTATSLAIEGVAVDADALVASYLRRVQSLLAEFEASGGDAIVSGLFDAVTECCGTLGARVRATVPSGDAIVGVAAGLGPDGTLRIVPDDAEPLSIAAGDIEHLRYE